MVKRPEEIELLQKAALATDKAIRIAYESGKVGVSDKVIADTLASGIQSGGADSLAFLVLGAGPSAALAHPTPSNRPLERGDVVRCDVGGYFSGYLSDLARTAVVGEPTPEQVEAYQKLFEIHEETIAAARPGIRAKDLFQHCKQAFENRGLALNLPHIGHSLGIGLHEAPVLHPFNETFLEKGMILAIEPVHRFDGGPIFHVEDLIEVTPEGGRVLSRAADWSELFVIDG
jgi:Xaa-Pro aminopeptidase